jgi:FMN phosphatase YigB (HAD superfamily)
MHIAVDMDDVVLDFIQGVRASFIREYGLEGIPTYAGTPWGPEVVEFYKHPLFLESGYKDWWGWLRDRHWLWATFPAVDGAIGGLQRLRARGHWVELVTSKPEWAESNVWKWLGRWRPPLNSVTIVRNGQRKADFTKAFVMVDDKRQTCEEFANAGRFGIHFDREMAAEPAWGLGVAHNWNDVINLIDTIQEDPYVPSD